jgi:predicted ribosome quality control (RQC) complex YloA/Tae2 family protein
MERKRELTSVDCAALDGELAVYEGAAVDKVYLYPERDLLRFRMRHYDHGRIELLVAVGEEKYLTVVDPAHLPEAPERPPNFAMMLRKRLKGGRLAGVEQFEFDRILELRFERDGDATRVVAELFGDGNVAVIDDEGAVVDSLQTVRLKSRTVAPGERYEFPEARFNPLDVDYEAFRARMRGSDSDVVRTLATQLNFGGLYGEELCTRAGVPYNVAIGEVTDDQLEAVYDAVRTVATRLTEGDLDPRVYYADDGEREADDHGERDDGPNGDRDEAAEPTTKTAEPGEGPTGRRIDATPVPLAEYADTHAEQFETFVAAIDDYVTFAGGDSRESDESSERGRPDFESEIETKERIITQQEDAIESFDEQARAEREKAEALYANYDLVDDVISTVREARADGHSWEEIAAGFDAGAKRGIDAAETVRAVDGSEGTVTLGLAGQEVAVDVADGVEKNADRLYTEAKRIEEKKTGAQAAIEETRAELEAVRQRRADWKAGDVEAGDVEDTDGEQAVDWLSRSSIPVRQPEMWYERFRWFHTSDGFLVIGGRDADENEAIVAKYLDRGDRFFHAQAHGGPATVLKATGPSESYSEAVEIPDRSRREAARFAVSYSSVWKDGRFAGDVYQVGHDQVTKTPESGEYLEKGGFAIRGDRTYHRDTEVGVAVGITCEPETRVIGGPPTPIEESAETSIEVEPGRFAQNDVGKRLYREFKGRFVDETFVRKVASPDLIQEFLPPGGSRIVD